MKTVEVNFDGLVGPSHFYGGLSYGNEASVEHALKTSNPKQAALQGLQKMRFLMDDHVPQAVLPPQPRPVILFLRQLGFEGKDIDILNKVYQHHQELFFSAYSASSMWAANAASVAPSSDTLDGFVHITPANLIANPHRALESSFNETLLRRIFMPEEKAKCVVHAPLPKSIAFSDEGAANHNRFCHTYGGQGVHLFVYGKHFFNGINAHKIETNKIETNKIETNKMEANNEERGFFAYKYPARQTYEASAAIARLNKLKPDHTFFVRQNPEAIEKGVFHNDVISVANQNVFLYHEDAFVNTAALINTLKENVSFPMHFIPVTSKELSLTDAVKSYLFNSQIVTLPDGTMALLAPVECQENPAAHRLLLKIQADDNPIQHIRFVDLRQSMHNGGGPACLRLRVVLKESEIKTCHSGVFLTNQLYESLIDWVVKHYRDRLTPMDLLDPLFIAESENALEALSQILGLYGLYSI